MSNDKASVQGTQHAFLVVWGWFAEETELIHKIQAVVLKQKTYTHSPQSKVSPRTPTNWCPTYVWAKAP
jgi:hypothetical protein